jgi:hypothetical protein
MRFPDAAAPRVRLRSESASAGTCRWTDQCTADLRPRAGTRVFVPEDFKEDINVKTAAAALADPARPARTS